MLMLAQMQSPIDGEPAAKFWIDPDVEVVLTGQINEHFPPEGAAAPKGDASVPPALMGRYNRGESREDAVSRSFEEIPGDLAQ